MKFKQPTFLARSMYDLNNIISLSELNKDEISLFAIKDINMANKGIVLM